LGVLGLIAGLTIPNVVVSVNRSRTKAAGKQLIQAVTEALRPAFFDGEIPEGPYGDISANGGKNHPLVQLLIKKMNPVLVCDTNDTNPACGNTDSNDWQFKSQPKLVFADGSILAFHYQWANHIYMDLDYNGLQNGPNYTWAQQIDPANASTSDRMQITFYYGGTPHMIGDFACKTGMSCPSTAWTQNTAIWQALYS
jgi:hypothetical protein